MPEVGLPVGILSFCSYIFKEIEILKVASSQSFLDNIINGRHDPVYEGVPKRNRIFLKLFIFNFFTKQPYPLQNTLHYN